MFKGCALYLHATVAVEDKPMRPDGLIGDRPPGSQPGSYLRWRDPPSPGSRPGPKGKPDHPDRQGSGGHFNSVCYKDLKLPSKLQQQRNALCQTVLIKELPTSDPGKKPVSPQTSIIGSPRPSSPRHPAPGPESPESDSLASATCTVPQAPAAWHT